MALENLKSAFSNTEKFNKTDLTKLNSQYDDTVAFGSTPKKPTKTTDIFNQPPFPKAKETTDIFGQPPFPKTTETTLGFRQPPFAKDTQKTDIFINTDVTNTSTFPTGTTLNPEVRNFQSFINTNLSNVDGFPNYVDLNDVLRSFPDSSLQYNRSPFQSAGNNTLGALYGLNPEPTGNIDFNAISNRRKNFFNSPYFPPNGTELWGDGPPNIRDYPSSELVRTPFETAGNLWNPDPTPVGQLNIPENLWPDASPTIRTGVGTYTPVVTQNTGDTAGEYFPTGGDLGLRLGENTTWSTLYTKDHTKKPINFDEDGLTSDNPFQPFNYGNPNIASTFGMGDSPGHSPPTSGFARSGGLLGISSEPYIISDLPTDGNESGRDINGGSRLLPFNRAITDTERIGKYLGSDSGLAFLLSSNAQLFINRNVVRKDDKLIRVPQRFNNGYNPLATLLAVSPVARLLGQAQPIVSIKSGFNVPNPFEKNYGEGGTVNHKLNETFTGGSSKGNDGLFGKFVDSAKNFLTSGVTSQTYKGDGDKMTLVKPIHSAKTLKDTEDKEFTDTIIPLIDKEENGMPFYFKDLRNNKYILFRAYLEGISENISPSWAETSYMGRSEPVYTYERSTRDITFTLKLMAQTKDELEEIYTKMNRLTSLCYPEYAKDDLLSVNLSTNKQQVSKTRMKPPLTKFRLGDYFGKKDKELLGFIRSLNYVVPEESTYETEKEKRVPKFVMATITYQVIHGTPPDMETNFYGFGRKYE